MTNRAAPPPIRVRVDSWTPHFDPALPAAAQASSGSTMVVETQCCSRGAVRRRISTSPETFRAELGWLPGMPVTGPIAVAGAQVGDTLAELESRYAVDNPTH